MDIGAVLFILGLLGLVAAYVGRPLLEQRGLKVTEEDREFSSLLARRDRVLDALEELDMDRHMKKIDSDDYQRRRAELVSEGAEVLRQLDQLNANLEISTEGESADVEGRIEQQVIRLRQQKEKQPSTTYCPACGAEALASDRFCTQCGEPLVEEVTA